MKKDWYDIKAPSMFSVRNIGKTLVSRTTGTKVRVRDGERSRKTLNAMTTKRRDVDETTTTVAIDTDGLFVSLIFSADTDRFGRP